MKLIYIYLACTDECTHKQEEQLDDPFLRILSLYGWNMTVFSEIFVHIMTSNDFFDGIGPRVCQVP